MEETQSDQTIPKDVSKLKSYNISGDEIHLQDLKTSSTILNWKREIHKLLEGERKSKFPSPFGSVGDYVDSLIILSNDKISSRLNFIEALDQIVSEANFDTCSLFKTDILLTLVAEFNPPKGFIVVADYLREGGIFEENHDLVGVYIPINIHEKALVALRAFFRVAPLEATAPAFLTYIGILRQHLVRQNYCGFAAKELIKLEILHTGTSEMREILKDYPESLEVLVPFLASEERRLYNKFDLKNLAVDCFEIESSEPFKKFTAVLQNLGEEIRYSDDLPDETNYSLKNVPRAIDFEEGDSYEFGFSDDEIKLFAKHMTEVSKEYLDRTEQLITSDEFTLEQKKEELSIYFYQSIGLGSRAMELFAERLNKIEAEIVIEDPEKLLIRYEDSTLDLEYEQKQIEKFRIWEMGTSQLVERLEHVVQEHENHFYKVASN